MMTDRIDRKAELICSAILIFTVIGWISNIIKLVGSSFDPITGMAVARIIGVFVAPLGAVLGYF